jgi:GT2 family glycosyltransferase
LLINYDDFIVVIPVYGNYDDFLPALQSVLKFTPLDVKIIIADDCFDFPVTAFLENEIFDRARIRIIEQSENKGFAGNCNYVFKLYPEKNIILVNSDVLVSIGWFEAMVQPLQEYENVATVTAMTNHGGLAKVKIDAEEVPFLEEDSLFELNFKLKGLDCAVLPKIPVGVGHCMLITREARSIFGIFDEIFSPGYGEEVDFSLRCSKRGFHHFLAKTFVSHRGGATFSKKSQDLQRRHEDIIVARYPNYHALVWDFLETNEDINYLFFVTLNLFRESRILVDCRLMLEKPTGTARLCYETAKVLSKYDSIKVTILVQSHLAGYWNGKFGANVVVVGTDQIESVIDVSGKFDLVYRPNQIGSIFDARNLYNMAHRVVVQQLDFISYFNFQYFDDYQTYKKYREGTYVMYETADAITYISNFVHNQAELEFRRCNTLDRIIPCGVDHFVEVTDSSPKTKTIVMYGANFAHKNWLYLISLFGRIIAKDNEIFIRLIGPTPITGSNMEAETVLLNSLPKANWRREPWISDESLELAIKSSSLVIYPTLTEGFGFVPFEAAKLGTACLFGVKTSLGDYLPNAPYSLSFSSDKDVEVILELASSVSKQNTQIEYINSVSRDLTWDVVGQSLKDLFHEVIIGYPHNSRLSKEVLYQQNNGEISLSEVLFRRMLEFSHRKSMLFFFPIGSHRRKVVGKLVLKILFK